MKTLLFAILLISLSGCTFMHKPGKPAPRDWLYGSAATLEVMDAYSTSVALSNDPYAYETGNFAKAIGGRRPSDKSLVLITAAKLGMLEYSRYWKPAYRYTFQWMLILERPGVIAANFKVAFDDK